MALPLKEIHRIQHSFRAVMDAMARPGRVLRMPLKGAVSAGRYPGIGAGLGTLVDMLVDQATTFAVANECDAALVQAIVAETHAKQAASDAAQFVVVPAHATAGCVEMAIAHASGGALISPELGATVFVECACLVPECEDASVDDACSTERLHWVCVQGPGVEGTHTFGVDRIDWACARARRTDEFPCGIDVVLVDAAGNVVACPRTSRIALDQAESEAC